MAREHGMIEPFERQPGAHRASSRTASARTATTCASRSEFRIFTNVLSSIVDPKQFDPNSFVEFEGDVCIVPPNSFALARSVEYFRIPRNVLTVTRRQIDLRAMRNHHERHAARAGVGRSRDARDLEHHSPSREDLRERRDRAGVVLQGRGRAAGSYRDKRASTRGRRASRCPSSDRATLVTPWLFTKKSNGWIVPTAAQESVRRSLARPTQHFLVASRQRRHHEVTVHPSDGVDADFLRTRILTLAVQRAVAEPFASICATMRERAPISFRLPLRQDVPSARPWRR